MAVHSLSGRRFRYGQLLGDVCKTRNKLRQAAGKEDIDGERIAFLVENSYDYVGEQWRIPPKLIPGTQWVAIWMSFAEYAVCSDAPSHSRSAINSGALGPSLSGP